MISYEFALDASERIEDYRLSCNRLADLFCERYEFYKLGETDSTFWVADEPGGFLCIGDLTFSMEEILIALQDNIDTRTLMRWADYCNDCFATETTPANLRTYNKLIIKEESESKNQETK